MICKKWLLLSRLLQSYLGPTNCKNWNILSSHTLEIIFLLWRTDIKTHCVYIMLQLPLLVFSYTVSIYTDWFLHFICSFKTANKHYLNASSKLATDFTKKKCILTTRDRQILRDEGREIGCAFQYLLGPSLSLTFDQCLPKDWPITPVYKTPIDQKALLNCF